MLEFGFYDTTDDINDLITNLLILVNGSLDVTSLTEEEKIVEKLERNENFLKNFTNLTQNVGNLFLGI